MKSKIAAAFLALLGGTSAAVQPAAAQSDPPKLIVVISVDQFSADMFAQYRQHFTGGLKRLSQGAVFPSGYQSHGATETCPGHSTILTGSRPARTGIIANNWFDLSIGREDKLIYCSEDARVPGSNSDDYTVSSRLLRVPTLGDLMRRRDPRSRSVAIAGKDRSAVMMGGHNPNARWYRDDNQFLSDLPGATPPASVQAANADIARRIASGSPAMDVPAACQAVSRPVPVGPPGRTVGAGRFERAPGVREGLFNSPEFDTFTLALAEGISAEMRLGQGDATDLLAIGLSGSDYIGHRFGNEGGEMCIQLFALDRMLGSYFERLDRAGIDYVVALTADHGGHDLPERARLQAMPSAERVEAALRPSAMNESLNRDLGLPGRLIYGDSAFGDFYVSRTLPDADRRRVLDAAIRAYRGHRQVQAVYTRAEIQAAPAPSGPPDTWTIPTRLQASFDPERSGDFYVVLKSQVTPLVAVASMTSSTATHGSVWDNDRRVPILFWRRGMAHFEQPVGVETADIMPTLAALIGLPIVPESIDGRCLDLDAGPGDSCGQ